MNWPRSKRPAPSTRSSRPRRRRCNDHSRNVERIGNLSMAIQSEPTPTAAGTPPTAQLPLQAVYLKDCSFEPPHRPRVTTHWKPPTRLDLNTALNLIERD